MMGKMQKYKKVFILIAVFVISLSAILGWGFFQRQEKEKSYNHAIELMESGSYEDAMAAFQTLGYYKDSILLFLEA